MALVATVAAVVASSGFWNSSKAAPPIPTEFLAPAAFGVLDLGDPVRFELASADCARTTVRAELVSEGVRVRGPVARGCAGIVWLPTVEQAHDAGYLEGRPATIALFTRDARVELRLMRREFIEAEAVAGDPAVVVSDDPRETAGAEAQVLEMGSGDVVRFAPTDLRSIYSVSIRSAVPEDGEAALWELRADDPTVGLLVAQGDLGYVGKTPANGGSYPSRWYTLSFRAPPVAPATGKLPPGARPLYFRLVAAPTPVRLNWFDFNGTGVRDPSVSRFTPDPEGTVVLFDATNGRFDGWTECGWTIPKDDGVGIGMRADFISASENTLEAPGCPTGPTATYVGSGVLSDDFFYNVRLRLRYRLEQFEDNGGILLNGQEFQVHDRGEWFTGGYWAAPTCGDGFILFGKPGFPAPDGDCGYPADRIKTSTFPDWAEMEIIQNGPDYLVRINGRDVTRYHRAANPDGTPNVLRGNRLVLSNFFATSNTIAPPTDMDHVWYNDIRVYHCTGPVDPATARSLDPLCATATHLPKFPSP